MKKIMAIIMVIIMVVSNINFVNAEGKIFINGGGENNIIFTNTTLGEVVIYKQNGKIRVVSRGTTAVGHGASLEENDNQGNGFGQVEIIILKPGEIIKLDGDFKSVDIQTKLDIQITGTSTIKSLNIAKTAEGSTVNLTKETKVEKLTIDAQSDITGEGRVTKVTVNASGTTIEQIPETITVSKAAGYVLVNNKTVTYKNNGGSDSSTIAVGTITVTPTTMALTVGEATGTITLTISPENATNKNIIWSSSNETIATVANGVVTPVSAGIATITVITEDGNKTATCEAIVNSLDLKIVDINVLTGSIIGTTVAMEYSINSTNGIDGIWFSCSDTNTVVTFIVGGVYVREKADVTNFRLIGNIATVAAAPTLIFNDVANSITGMDSTYEYKIDAGAWISGEVAGDFSGTKTVLVRLKATDSALASQNQTINFSTNLVLDGVGINIALGNITETAATMQWSLDSTNGINGTWADCTATNTAVTFNDGPVYVREKAQTGNFRLVASIASAGAAPVSGVTYSVVAGTITGLGTTYEYSINGGGWSTTATGVVFAAGDITVRTKATVSALPSLAQVVGTLVVGAAPASPTESFKSYYCIGLVANALHEFSKDYGVTWQDREVFYSLSPTTMYNFITRVKATTTTLASDVSVATSITTTISESTAVKVNGVLQESLGITGVAGKTVSQFLSTVTSRDGSTQQYYVADYADYGWKTPRAADDIIQSGDILWIISEFGVTRYGNYELY
ncbi:MAG TPA: hypothetical protein DEP72_08410 [Clostridiales bacterium]|nr:MAG: hypothetical protein A2Y18_08135 [Clostridiales bacterium GWD2_32_19]HCC08159.1 hypothetical protein [Clostridiales bacterium]